MIDVCWGCKHRRDIVHTDPLARRFCQECAAITQMGDNEKLARAFLAVTVPFEVGDRVECRTAGERYDGTGVIDKMSMDLRDGGTPVIPLFHVNFDTAAREKYDGWYSEYDLTKVGAA
jgi:hypothetical protein